MNTVPHSYDFASSAVPFMGLDVHPVIYRRMQRLR